MSIEYPPHDKQASRDTFRIVGHADNVVPLREDNGVRQAIEAPPQDDELLTALSPLLDEVDGLRGAEARQEAGNIPVLLEENARFASLRSSCQISSAIFPTGHVRSKFLMVRNAKHVSGDDASHRRTTMRPQLWPTSSRRPLRGLFRMRV